jgi:S1-C subfamily serine protease
MLGSGFIIDGNGLILTNSHVVFGLQSLVVTLDNGEIVPAKVVGADPIFDLAVIQISKPKRGTLPTVKLGDSDKPARRRSDRHRQPVGWTRRHAWHRQRPQSPAARNAAVPDRAADQTDTAINPGNSGTAPEPLRRGHRHHHRHRSEAQNIGFAIPINLAKASPGLIKTGM